MLFTKYKGHQTYFCTAVMITPSSAVVLDRHMQMYFVLKKELLRTSILELDTLFPFLSTLAIIDSESVAIVILWR